MKRMLFIFNPNSGRGQIKTKLAEIADIFVKGGYEVTVYPTQARCDAMHKVISRGADFDVIVCSGGDGTLNEVITGMMRLNVKIPLGYIPSGTMNDFASSLKIPKGLIEAAERIVGGETAEVDIGEFNGDYFTYVAGFGAFTDVSYETSRQMKSMFGSFAYGMEAMKRLGTIKSYRVDVISGDKRFSGDFIFGMVSNSKSVAGIKDLGGKDVSLDDGVFECLLIENPKNLSDFQMTVNSLLRREMNADNLYYFKTPRAEFYSDDCLPWTLDGEYGGNCRNVVIENRHRAVTIFV